MKKSITRSEDLITFIEKILASLLERKGRLSEVKIPVKKGRLF